MRIIVEHAWDNDSKNIIINPKDPKDMEYLKNFNDSDYDIIIEKENSSFEEFIETVNFVNHMGRMLHDITPTKAIFMDTKRGY